MRFEVDLRSSNYADYRLCEAIKGGLFFRLICTFFKGVSGLAHSIVKSMATVIFLPRYFMEIKIFSPIIYGNNSNIFTVMCKQVYLMYNTCIFSIKMQSAACLVICFTFQTAFYIT